MRYCDLENQNRKKNIEKNWFTNDRVLCYVRKSKTDIGRFVRGFLLKIISDRFLFAVDQNL